MDRDGRFQGDVQEMEKDQGVPVRGISRSSVKVPHESRVHHGAVSSLEFRLHKGTHQAVLIGAEFLTHWREWDCNRSSLALRSNEVQTGSRDGFLGVVVSGKDRVLGRGSRGSAG